MRRLTVFLLFLGACTPLSVQRDQAAESASAPKQIQSAHRIEIDSLSWGVHSGTESTQWVLVVEGKCYCETNSVPRMASPGQETQAKKRWELPPEAFAEVQRILIESKIWAVQKREVFEFEGGVRLTVAWDGYKHSFNYYPDEAKRLMDYLGKLADKPKS